MIRPIRFIVQKGECSACDFVTEGSFVPRERFSSGSDVMMASWLPFHSSIFTSDVRLLYF